jgi:hypothetical protein
MLFCFSSFFASTSSPIFPFIPIAGQPAYRQKNFPSSKLKGKSDNKKPTKSCPIARRVFAEIYGRRDSWLQAAAPCALGIAPKGMDRCLLQWRDRAGFAPAYISSPDGRLPNIA